MTEVSLRRLAAALVLALLGACAGEGPLTAKTGGVSSQVIVGDVTLLIPSPPGLVPLAAVRGEERHWVEALVLARTAPKARVLAAFIQPDGFTVEQGAVSEAWIERGMEGGDVSLDEFRFVKRLFAIMVVGEAARHHPGSATVAMFGDTPRSLQLSVIQTPRGTAPPGAQALGLILVKGRVMCLETFGATTRFGGVDGLQQFHSRWMRAVIEANTTEAERNESPGEVPAPPLRLPEA
jgi:hypothetical protein